MTATIEPAQDEYVVDNPRLRSFIDAVSRIRHERDDPQRDHRRHPAAFCRAAGRQDLAAAAVSGAGRGERHGLRHRHLAPLSRRRWQSRPLGARRAAGAQTPVHDHLAWGLVGLYRGTQDEDVFTRTDDGSSEDEASLTITESRASIRAISTSCSPRPISTGCARRRGDLRLTPPARHRQRLHLAPPLRARGRQGSPVQERLRQRAVRRRVVG